MALCVGPRGDEKRVHAAARGLVERSFDAAQRCVPCTCARRMVEVELADGGDGVGKHGSGEVERGGQRPSRACVGSQHVVITVTINVVGCHCQERGGDGCRVLGKPAC